MNEELNSVQQLEKEHICCESGKIPAENKGEDELGKFLIPNCTNCGTNRHVTKLNNGWFFCIGCHSGAYIFKGAEKELREPLNKESEG